MPTYCVRGSSFHIPAYLAHSTFSQPCPTASPRVTLFRLVELEGLDSVTGPHGGMFAKVSLAEVHAAELEEPGDGANPSDRHTGAAVLCWLSDSNCVGLVELDGAPGLGQMRLHAAETATRCTRVLCGANDCCEEQAFVVQIQAPLGGKRSFIARKTGVGDYVILAGRHLHFDTGYVPGDALREQALLRHFGPLPEAVRTSAVLCIGRISFTWPGLQDSIGPLTEEPSSTAEEPPAWGGPSEIRGGGSPDALHRFERSNRRVIRTEARSAGSARGGADGLSSSGGGGLRQSPTQRRCSRARMFNNSSSSTGCGGREVDLPGRARAQLRAASHGCGEADGFGGASSSGDVSAAGGGGWFFEGVRSRGTSCGGTHPGSAGPVRESDEAGVIDDGWPSAHARGPGHRKVGGSIGGPSRAPPLDARPTSVGGLSTGVFGMRNPARFDFVGVYGYEGSHDASNAAREIALRCAEAYDQEGYAGDKSSDASSENDVRAAAAQSASIVALHAH